MTAEGEILEDLLDTIRSVIGSAQETLALIPSVPDDPDELVAAPPLVRVATTAAMKQFEQLEDLLNGLFRTILRCQGVRLKGLYALDIGARMEELDILDDAARWLAIVKLRNELVHEYPVSGDVRLLRLRAAIEALPLLFDAAARAEAAVRRLRLLEDLPE